MATVIEVDGVARQIAPANGSNFTLKELYQILGCNMIQTIPTNGGVMIMDEEAKCKDPEPPVNAFATMLGHRAGTQLGDFILGPVLLTTLKEMGE